MLLSPPSTVILLVGKRFSSIKFPVSFDKLLSDKTTGADCFPAIAEPVRASANSVPVIHYENQNEG